MAHLLDIRDLDADAINTLLTRARLFKAGKAIPQYPHHSLATLFYEDSTRTRVSFELAAKKLNLPVINLQLATSSESKGETVLDTVLNLQAMGINLLVIRHKTNFLMEYLASQLTSGTQIINAGDGTNAHPSQALLDLMTIQEQYSDFSRLTIAIVGNIKHSRVANSLQHAFYQMGVKRLRLVAPEIWLPDNPVFGECTQSLQAGLNDVDIVYCLRVQKERLNTGEMLDLDTYHQHYGLTQSSRRYAKPDAMIMHPGPVNRGIEINSELVDCSQSYILRQVQNGVFMRMAIIDYLSR